VWKTSQHREKDTDKTRLLQDEQNRTSPTKKDGISLKLWKTSQRVDEHTEVENSNSEKDGINIGATLRNEKIENAPSIANAARRQRQRQPTTADPAFIMQNALVERLEAKAKLLANEKECTNLPKLLANEKECINLQNLAVAGRLGIPVSLSMLSLGCDPEKDWSCVVDDFLLQKLEAKENECTHGSKALGGGQQEGYVSESTRKRRANVNFDAVKHN
jgi:hypothetical protein